jgi:hypothetical protein
MGCCTYNASVLFIGILAVSSNFIDDTLVSTFYVVTYKDSLERIFFICKLLTSVELYDADVLVGEPGITVGGET